jgi:hypothetical protein
MSQEELSTRQRGGHAQEYLNRRDVAHGRPEIEALIEENAGLRTLVVQLTKLVIKNVVERKY